jgi:hypothetical protein
VFLLRDVFLVVGRCAIKTLVGHCRAPMSVCANTHSRWNQVCNPVLKARASGMIDRQRGNDKKSNLDLHETTSHYRI